MPRFTPNPAAATAGFPIYPAGEYEVVIGEPKSFFREGKDGKAANYGITFRSTIAEGEYAGKPIMLNCYMHTLESEGFSKQIQMASLGYTKDKEDTFNTDCGSLDWSFDTDNGSAGEAWHKMKGTRIIVALDVKMGNGGEQQQQTKSFRPLTA